MTKAVSEKDRDVLNQIFQKGVLIDLDVSWWMGQTKLRPEDLGIPGKNINLDLFSLGRKRYIPKTWIGKFRKYEQLARQNVARYCFKYKNLGGWYIPMGALRKLVGELEYCKGEFYKVVEEFRKNYPRIKEKMIKEYEKETDTIYKRLRTLTRQLPAQEDFRKIFMKKIKDFYPVDPTDYFKFTFTFFEITIPRDFQAKVTNIKKKLTKEEQKTQREELRKQTLINQYRNSFQTQINEFLGSVVLQLRSSTVEFAERVRKQIEGGKVTEPRLNRIREYIERFKMINFIDDREVQKELETLKKHVTKKSADDFNSNQDLETRLRETLGKVVQAASKNGSDVIKKSFSYKRRIVRKK